MVISGIGGASKSGAGMDNLLPVAIFGTMFCAWCQHVYTCFNEETWGFLIAGALFFPIAIIHGIGLWLGFW